MECSVSGCGKPVYVTSRMLCKTHYHRQMRTGGLSITRDAPDLFRLCSVNGCGLAHKAKGFCHIHYQYKRRYGSPTPNLQPVGGTKKYEITEGKDGYLYRWDKQLMRINLQHRIVMAEKIGRALFRHESVHHKNGDRKDNRIDNLELWSSWQPAGQRIEDKVSWAIDLLKLYKPEALK